MQESPGKSRPTQSVLATSTCSIPARTVRTATSTATDGRGKSLSDFCFVFARAIIEFWSIDAGPETNANLEFVIDDAARTVLALRQEGKRVLLHCVEGRSRTPSVAARYSMLLGKDPAAVPKAMPWADPKPALWRAAGRPEVPPTR